MGDYTHRDTHPFTKTYCRMKIKDIFEPFDTNKSKEEGTGLGLWVTHGIVQPHGGTIAVNSQYGKGTSFIVSLPML